MLTDARIRNAKPKDRSYRLTDAHGLALEIASSGARYWRYRYRLAGRENLFAGGSWCQALAGELPEKAASRRAAGELTLAEARIAREDWRRMVKAGQHPAHVRKSQRLDQAAGNALTFEAVAADFIAQRGRGWATNYRLHLTRFLAADVSPYIGSLPIRAVTPAHLLDILRRVEARGSTSVAVLGRSWLSRVFRFAIASLKADSDPAAALVGALQRHETKHHAPLGRNDVAPFFEALRKANVSRPVEIAVELLALTFVRTVELRRAAWEEFDLERAEWRIPAARMKMRRPHIVPLSTQAVALLLELRSITGRSRWLFPNARRPADVMGVTTINSVIERMGFRSRFTAHGFRATASTMLHESGVASDIIERQLAHAERNKSRASYDHSGRLPERRAMMQAWADMLDRMSHSASTVITLRQRSA